MLILLPEGRSSERFGLALHLPSRSLRPKTRLSRHRFYSAANVCHDSAVDTVKEGTAAITDHCKRAGRLGWTDSQGYQALH